MRNSMTGCKPLLIAILAFALVVPAQGQVNTHVDKGGGKISGVAPIYLYSSAGPMQFLNSTQLAIAQNLPSIPAAATVAEICVENAGIRYRDDGTPPTASVGVPVIAAASAPVCFQYAGSLSAIQFIMISGSPSIDVAYYLAN